MPRRCSSMGLHRGMASPSPAQKAVRITLEAQKETKVLGRQRLRTFVLGGASPASEKAEVRRPYLRDVSRDVEPEAVEEIADAERSEQLRQKVRETRERLRGPKDKGPER